MNKPTKIEAAGLHEALVAAQTQLQAPKKDREVTVKTKTGGSYKFAYATMARMVEEARPILTAHGLWFVQFVSDGQMVTRIIHANGEHMDCGIPMPNLPSAPQEAGSIITYFKRYSFCAAFGLVAEEEDDANIAEGNGYSAPKDTGSLTQDQWETLEKKADEVGADKALFCQFLKVKSIRDIPASRYQEALDALAAKKKTHA